MMKKQIKTILDKYCDLHKSKVDYATSMYTTDSTEDDYVWMKMSEAQYYTAKAIRTKILSVLFGDSDEIQNID
jgi:hypothetical protein